MTAFNCCCRKFMTAAMATAASEVILSLGFVFDNKPFEHADADGKPGIAPS